MRESMAYLCACDAAAHRWPYETIDKYEQKNISNFRRAYRFIKRL